jgi:hypothetical protein
MKATRSVLHILLSLLFCLTVYGINARPDACFCGEACAHFLCDQQPENSLPYHKRCHHSGCKPCNVEKGTHPDMRTPPSADHGKKGGDSEQFAVALADDLLIVRSLRPFCSVCCVARGDPPLIYLQHCSFLC